MLLFCSLLNCHQEKESQCSLEIDIPEFYGGVFKFLDLTTGTNLEFLNTKLAHGVSYIEIPDSLFNRVGSYVLTNAKSTKTNSGLLFLGEHSFKAISLDNNISFTGNPIQKTIGSFILETTALEKKFKRLKKNETDLDSLNDLKSKLDFKVREFADVFNRKGFSNISSLILLNGIQSNLISESSILKLRKNCQNANQEYWDKKLCSFVDKSKITTIDIGKFELESFSESLPDRNAKLLLFDFWASWCSPCIKEIPMLKNLYKKYNFKGLEIISISKDHSSVKWKLACEKHDLPWPNFRDHTDLNKSISHYLNIGPIPHFMFVDNSGNILNYDVSKDSLEYFISSQLNLPNSPN